MYVSCLFVSDMLDSYGIEDKTMVRVSLIPFLISLVFAPGLAYWKEQSLAHI